MTISEHKVRALCTKTGELVTVYATKQKGKYEDWKHRLYDEKDLKFAKSVYTRDEEAGLKAIREALLADGLVDVHNEYETFYGCGFDSWLRKGLADIPCEIVVRDINQWEGYPWSYDIVLKK